MPEEQGVRYSEDSQEQQTVANLSASENLLRQKNEDTWWSASLSSVEEAEAVERPTIPLPPQIKLEQQRFEAARAAADKAETLRRAMVKRDEDRRRTAKAANAVAVNCVKCGTRVNETPSHAFSFCTVCGADLPARVSAAAPTSRTMPPAPTQQAFTSMSSTAVMNTGVTGATAQRGGRVEPGVAAMVSFFVPGVGQIMNGQTEKGVLLLLGLYVAAFLFGLPAFGLPMLLARIIIAIDSYRIAQRKRKGQMVRSGEWDIS